MLQDERYVGNEKTDFIIKKFDVLAEYFEQQTNCSRYRRKMSQSRKKSFVEESVLFTFPHQTNGNHVTEP